MTWLRKSCPTRSEFNFSCAAVAEALRIGLLPLAFKKIIFDSKTLKSSRSLATSKKYK